MLRVEVQDDGGTLLAAGDSLQRTADTPMAILERSGKRITRRDIWPDEAHFGMPVILAGGEVGILVAWWNSEARDEWRWRLELYNHR